VVIARYAYDVLGRRIVKRVYQATTGGGVRYTRFAYAGANVAQERDSTGGSDSTAVKWQYAWGPGVDNLVGFQDSTGTPYYVAQISWGAFGR
jgi:hypothetical protein